MRDNNDTDFVLPFSSGDVTLEDPEGRTVAADPTRQLLGSVEFRLSLEDVKGLIELSKAVERMQEAVWDIPVAIGPLVGHGEGGRIRSIPTYQIATGPFFHNLTDVTPGWGAVLIRAGMDRRDHMGYRPRHHVSHFRAGRRLFARRRTRTGRPRTSPRSRCRSDLRTLTRCEGRLEFLVRYHIWPS